MNQVLESIKYSILLTLLSGIAYAGVGDGPRAYQVAPVGSQSMSILPIYQNSRFNIDGSPSEPIARIEVNLVALQYSFITEVADQTAGFYVVLPTGEVNGKVINTSKSGESSGIGDIIIGGVIGLNGAPAMTPKDFSTYKPEFGVGLLMELTLPTGEYDSNKLFNLGSNRWSTRMGAVVSWYFGESLLPGQVTSIELVPTVTFYGNNDDINNGNILEQEPVYALEANFTHDFNTLFWGSIDALYKVGGRAITDGIRAEGDTDIFALGATVGTYLPEGFSLQLNYGQTLKVDTDGYRDHLVRIKLSKSF